MCHPELAPNGQLKLLARGNRGPGAAVYFGGRGVGIRPRLTEVLIEVFDGQRHFEELAPDMTAAYRKMEQLALAMDEKLLTRWESQVYMVATWIHDGLQDCQTFPQVWYFQDIRMARGDDDWYREWYDDDLLRECEEAEHNWNDDSEFE
jgi:hypothetical protein